MTRLVTTYFCAGLEVDWQGRVFSAAPILRWAIGKSAGDVYIYFKRKGVFVSWEVLG